MQNVRQILVDRAKRLDLDSAALGRMLRGKVHKQTIYNLMEGAEVSTRSLGHILNALGLRIVVAPDAIRTPKRAAKPKAAGRRRKQT